MKRRKIPPEIAAPRKPATWGNVLARTRVRRTRAMWTSPVDSTANSTRAVSDPTHADHAPYNQASPRTVTNSSTMELTTGREPDPAAACPPAAAPPAGKRAPRPVPRPSKPTSIRAAATGQLEDPSSSSGRTQLVASAATRGSESPANRGWERARTARPDRPGGHESTPGQRVCCRPNRHSAKRASNAPPAPTPQRRGQVCRTQPTSRALRVCRETPSLSPCWGVALGQHAGLAVEQHAITAGPQHTVNAVRQHRPGVRQHTADAGTDTYRLAGGSLRSRSA